MFINIIGFYCILLRPALGSPAEWKRGVAVCWWASLVQLFHLFKKVSDKVAGEGISLEGDKYWVVVRMLELVMLVEEKTSEFGKDRGLLCYCVGCFGMKIDHSMQVTVYLSKDVNWIRGLHSFVKSTPFTITLSWLSVLYSFYIQRKNM